MQYEKLALLTNWYYKKTFFFYKFLNTKGSLINIYKIFFKNKIGTSIIINWLFTLLEINCCEVELPQSWNFNEYGLRNTREHCLIFSFITMKSTNEVRVPCCERSIVIDSYSGNIEYLIFQKTINKLENLPQNRFSEVKIMWWS